MIEQIIAHQSFTQILKTNLFLALTKIIHISSGSINFLAQSKHAHSALSYSHIRTGVPVLKYGPPKVSVEYGVPAQSLQQQSHGNNHHHHHHHQVSHGGENSLSFFDQIKQTLGFGSSQPSHQQPQYVYGPPPSSHFSKPHGKYGPPPKQHFVSKPPSIYGKLARRFHSCTEFSERE